MPDRQVQSINPATGEVIESFTPLTHATIETALENASERFRTWRNVSLDERAELLNRAADVLETKAAEYARDITLEMGKPLSQAEAEVRKCATACRHYAEHGATYLQDETFHTEARRAFVRHLPMGPVLAVMPWNFPFWQVFRFAAPALMAGNVGLLKHASNVWRSALNIEDVFHRAGFPDGCFQTLLIGSSEVEGVIRDNRIKAVTLTGSGPAGRSVAAIAGDCIKPSLLELGGSDAFIVMPSADLDKAVKSAVTARIQNSGQSCIAGKRFFVHADIFEAFSKSFVKAFDALKVDDPMKADTDVGPLATLAIRDELADQIERSLKGGAESLTKDRTVPKKGAWIAPQILAEAHSGTPSTDEEMFGPVANLWKVSNLDDAITRANRSQFGLGSVLFSKEEAEIDQAIRQLEAGATFVNSMVASDPRLPFGGIKQSGYGRELAADGLRAFVNRKTVSVA
ncbi:NAD-dependent succinate-semialdehyde dehydrogenase [Hyphomonas jannaschiana]|uniref:Aldehyde dehydrogenase n=1 Tax=Hyphomonas jannaschiana VP2 TaxID=1280952 RepID=A0A059F865_9PROT|nr:NAD-dependent succinate-semialdehyde dehydrogenase [Hyphomonas jannaschiana]KCZ86782.1 aldehyde dehydrogenase [Hyphomonas jannaschiana VP2]